MTNKIGISIEKSILFNALANVQSAVDNKSTIALLNNVKLDVEGGKLTITATDMDIMVSEAISCESDVEGSLTVGARALFDVVRKMPEDSISIRGDSDTGKCQIKSKGFRFSLPCLSSNEFPIIERGDLDCEVDINSIEFLKLLNKTKFAMSNDEVKYNLNGINLRINESNNLVSYATNGHKLARLISESNDLDFPSITIHSKAIGIILKALDKINGNLKISVSTSKICILCDNFIIISKLIDGAFPDVERVFPAD